MSWMYQIKQIEKNVKKILGRENKSKSTEVGRWEKSGKGEDHFYWLKDQLNI